MQGTANYLVFCLVCGLVGRVDVLIVSPTSSGLGGVARHVSGLKKRLVEAGYGVTVISSENTPILPVKGLKNPTFMVSSLFKSLLRKASVVHAHSIPASLGMKAASAPRKVLTIHGIYAEQVNLLHGGAVGRVASLLERRAVRWADVVTVVSLKAVEAYRRMGVEAVYIPNAVDLPVDGVEEIRLNERQAVFVGRLSKEKNPEAFLEVAKQIPDAVFVIVGDGPLRKQLEERAKGLGNVVLTGPVEHRRALGYIAGSDVLVLPSVVEGMSTVLLEAMALKTPVVASAVGGNTEIIEHGVSGLLVQPNDIEQLAESVSKLLTEPKYASHLAENAYNKVINNFSWDVVFPMYLRVYGLG